MNHWIDVEDNLCVLLPKLANLGCIGNAEAASSSLACPQAWQKHIVDAFENITALFHGSNTVSSDCSNHIGRIQAYLDILSIMKSDVSTRDRIQSCLLGLLHTALQSDIHDGLTAKFAVGKGFVCYLRYSEMSKTIDTSLWPLLCTSGPRFITIPLFLQGLQGYIEQTPRYVC